MSDFPGFPGIGDKPIVYVRSVETSRLPKEVRKRTAGMEQLFAIHAENGEVLALVGDRNKAFVVARRNELSPVSVH